MNEPKKDVALEGRISMLMVQRDSANNTIVGMAGEIAQLRDMLTQHPNHKRIVELEEKEKLLDQAQKELKEAQAAMVINDDALRQLEKARSRISELEATPLVINSTNNSVGGTTIACHVTSPLAPAYEAQ